MHISFFDTVCIVNQRDHLSVTWAYVYSLPLLPFSSPLLWVYDAILPKYGYHIKQLCAFNSKSTKYFYILRVLTCEEVLHAPSVQI